MITQFGILHKIVFDKNVFLVTGIGNSGTANNNGLIYPGVYAEWYAIGSIDHEGSNQGKRSAISAWYDPYNISANKIVNWVMPGNGVPFLHFEINCFFFGSSYYCYENNIWKYGLGTSYSAPYLAAIGALVIVGYHKGDNSLNDPSISQLTQILYNASSRSTYDIGLGFGFVDTYLAYGKAFYEGRK